MADTIKEFLVGLGWKVDGAGEKRFKDAVETATLRANLLAEAIAAAAKAVAKAVADMADDFEQIYYASQRTGASIQNLKGLSYAVSQLGGSYNGALNSVENFARAMRTNPGYGAMVRSLGVATEANGKLRDTTAVLTDLGRVFAGQKYEIAYQYAQALGLDEATFRALRDQPEALRKFKEEYERTAKVVGLDGDKAGKASAEFMQTLRSLTTTIGVVAQKIFTDLSPALREFLERINDWIAKHPEEIKEGILAIGKATIEFAKALGGVATAIAPAIEGIGKMAASITGADSLQEKMELFLKFLLGVWVVKVLGGFSAIGGGWAALLLRLGLPAAIGVAASGGGHETPEQYGQRLQSDPAARQFEQERLQQREKVRGYLGDVFRPKEGDTRSFWERAAPESLGGKAAPTQSASPGSAAPITGSTFGQKAPGVMQRLMDDFGLSKDEAAVVLGNLGHESGGFKHYQELSPTVPGSRGGAGWAQWTGPRRRAFEKWASENGLDPRSDEANYGFLKHELQTTHRNALQGLKRAEGSEAKMYAFEQAYEGAGVKHYGSRFRFMQQAKRAYEADEADPWSPNKAGNYNWNKVSEALGRYDFGASKRVSEAEPLGIGSTNNATNNVFNLTPQTSIKVDGAGNPNETASAVARAQTDVNRISIRNAQSAIR